jgi:hypothetical protein
MASLVRTGGKPYRAEIAAPDGVRVAAASRVGICVRIHEVYHAPRIVLF